jgi:hypothetical protein
LKRVLIAPKFKDFFFLTRKRNLRINLLKCHENQIIAATERSQISDFAFVTKPSLCVFFILTRLFVIAPLRRGCFDTKFQVFTLCFFYTNALTRHRSAQTRLFLLEKITFQWQLRPLCVFKKF